MEMSVLRVIMLRVAGRGYGGDLPHEINLRQGQSAGLDDEVAEDVFQR